MLTKKNLGILITCVGVIIALIELFYLRTNNAIIISICSAIMMTTILAGLAIIVSEQEKDRADEIKCMVDNYISDIKKLDDTQLLKRLIDYKSLPDWKVTALNMEGTDRWVKLLQQIKKNIGDKS